MAVLLERLGLVFCTNNTTAILLKVGPFIYLPKVSKRYLSSLRPESNDENHSIVILSLTMRLPWLS